VAQVKIDIASEFTGAKAFKQADTATQKLTNNVKSLARNFGLAFSTAAVLSYAKKSVKAASEDQAAQASLAQTLKNLGYQNSATAVSVNDFISSLERQTGILDDELRPAMDRLLRATGSVTESQNLMSLALDISAGTGKTLSQVSQSLQKAFLGQTQALGRLGVGLSKAELTSSNFEQITARLTVLFAGQAKRQADSFKGSIDKLAVAANNASETIGTGLIDALKTLGENTSIEDLASNMEKTSIYIADVIRGVGVLAAKLKDIPVLGNFNVGMIPIIGSYIELLRNAGTKTAELTSADNAHLKSLQDSYKVTSKTVTNAKILTKEQAAQLKAKKLQIAIDKAELALGKGTDVFDMEKIQLLAAEKSAVEQIGKATSQAQLLGITGDLARLRVKQDIIALEDAIASKDEKSIIAATNKLNADLKILGALTGQDLKLKDIKSILEDIVPKDLINLTNLDEAIAKLKLIAAGFGATTTIATPTPTETIKKLLTNAEVNALLVAGSFVPVVAGTGGVVGGSTSAGAYASSGFPGADTNNGSVNITVNTGIGDPNAIAEAIEQVVRGAVDRGTLRAS
jgi:hypothetical protein